MRRALALALWLACATAAAQPQTLTPLPDRPPAPDFALVDAEGKEHRLSDYRGQVVLVNFWATWCPPCRREMPSMQRLWEALRGTDFRMLAVDVGEDDETVFSFIFALDTAIEFPMLLDRDGKVTERWPVIGLPTSFLVDRSGRLAYRAIGGRDWDDPALVESIRELMAE